MSHSIPDILSESIDETNIELEMCTKEQLSAVLSPVPEQWIIGPAGGGKTWLLMKKELMLAKNALSEGKKEKILVACHNEPLAKNFRKVFEGELIFSFPKSGDLEKVVEVKTFDSLLYDITGDFGQNMGKHVAQALELLEKGTMLTQRYDHILLMIPKILGRTNGQLSLRGCIKIMMLMRMMIAVNQSTSGSSLILIRISTVQKSSLSCPGNQGRKLSGSRKFSETLRWSLNRKRNTSSQMQNLLS